ncbi:MAG: ComF family protein [Chloroflexota bacterium]
MRAAARYELLLREAIHRLKYSGHRGLAVELAAWLEVAAAAYMDQVEALVPVPLHPARQRARGYNQSALLARELGQRCHMPVEDELLARVVDTRDQVKLTRVERQRNVRGAFACARPSAVAGRSLLLVDDVCTTGSTLLACAAALTAAGAGSVRAVVLARQDAARE